MGGNRRYNDQPSSIPTWAATIGAMHRNGVLVYATCTDCGFYCRHVDLGAMIETRGPDYSLFDVHRACLNPTCLGELLFMYSPSPSTPARKCSSSRA
jgi:hypothetical protein